MYSIQKANRTLSLPGILRLSHSKNHHRGQIAANHENNPESSTPLLEASYLLSSFQPFPLLLPFFFLLLFPPSRAGFQLNHPKPIHQGPLRVGLDVLKKEGPTSRHFAPPRARGSGQVRPDRSFQHCIRNLGEDRERKAMTLRPRSQLSLSLRDVVMHARSQNINGIEGPVRRFIPARTPLETLQNSENSILRAHTRHTRALLPSPRAL